MKLVENPSECRNCRFFDRSAVKTHWGDCRRRAPTTRAAPTTSPNLRGWPLVLESDWCGEWEQRP